MVDLQGLIRRDHDELEAALVALGDPVASQVASLIETAQLILTVHAAAETRVLLVGSRMARATPHAAAIVASLDTICHDQREQGAMLDRLARTSPNTPGWCETVLELQVLALDHRWCTPNAFSDLRMAIGPSAFDDLAGVYASARLLAFTTLAPTSARPRRRSAGYAAALA